MRQFPTYHDFLLKYPFTKFKCNEVWRKELTTHINVSYHLIIQSMESTIFKWNLHISSDINNTLFILIDVFDLVIIEEMLHYHL
jgi:hypothetical protein